MNNKNIQEGPSFETKSECGECKYLSIVDPSNRCGIIATCNKLNKELHQRSNNDSIIPHSDCPFQFLSSINYHKDKIKRLDALEFDKVKSIVSSIFKDAHSFDHSLAYVIFRYSDTIELNRMKQLEEKLPNYDIEFDSYDSDDISVTLNLKAV